jgi:hypothetical protein
MNALDQPYTLTFEQRDGYLYVHIEANAITRQIALDYLARIATKCTELDVDRVLLERAVPDFLSTVDLFFTGERFAELMRGRRVAIVNANKIDEEGLHFALMVSNNRGAQFEAYATVEAAEKWLLGCVCMMLGSNVPLLFSHALAAA